MVFARFFCFFRRALAWLALAALCAWPAGAHAVSHVVTAAVPGHFPPQYVIDQDGHLGGFGVEVLDAAARKAGLEVEYLVMKDWAQAQDALASGQVDLIPNMGVTPGRARIADFTAPVETFPVSVFVRREQTNVDGLNDLADRQVGVVHHNLGERLLMDRKEFKLTVAEDIYGLIFLLLSGRVDAAVFPVPVFWNIAREARAEHRFRVVGPPLVEVKRAIAVAKGRPELLAALGRAVEELVPSREFRAIYQKWYGRAQPFWTARRVFAVMGGLLAASLAVLIGWWFFSLKRVNRALAENIRHRQHAEQELARHLERLEDEVREHTQELEAEVENRARAEEGLRKARDLFEKVLDLQRDVIVVYSPWPSRVLYVNQAVEKTFGFTRRETLGREFGFLMDEEARQEARRAFRESVNAKGFYETGEVELRRKDGTVILTEQVSVPMYGEDGELRAWVAVVRDVTQRRAQERERERLIEELQAALAEVKTLRGFLPICSHCKKIRNDEGYWLRLEGYIETHSEAVFSHGICPDCMREHYPDFSEEEEERQEKKEGAAKGGGPGNASGQTA